MSEFKEGDEVILVPPIELESAYIPWVGRFAKVIEVKDEKGTTWYKIEVSGSEPFSAPENWLKAPEPVCCRHA